MPQEVAKSQDSPQPSPSPKGNAVLNALRRLGGWLAASRIRAIPFAVGGMVLIGSIGAVAVFLAKRKPAEKPISLEETLAALDRGVLREARRLAEKFQRQGPPSMDQWGGVPYVLGTAAERDAADAAPRDRPAAYFLAARCLEEADHRGFPAGRQAEGLFSLGRCLTMAGRFAAARPLLLADLKINPRRKSEIHRLLAIGYAEDGKPAPAKALAEIEPWLADADLTPAAREEALLLRARCQFGLDRAAECLATLDKIPRTAETHAQAIVLRGRVLRREARQLADRGGADGRAQRGRNTRRRSKPSASPRAATRSAT